MIQKEYVHDFIVQFDDSFIDGLRYLRDHLSFDEMKTLTDAARLDGSAEFEDNFNRNWTLLYNRGEGTYTLIRRQ